MTETNKEESELLKTFTEKAAKEPEESAISEFVLSELCDYDDESGRYFREDTVIAMIKTFIQRKKIWQLKNIL